MVSGTRRPAGSDLVKKWSENRAAAQKARCSVEHRGEFPNVLRGHISGFRWLISAKQVIQGLHMVSGTRCPAWSDQLKRWSESRAAAPKDRCPVGHRGEFPYVLRRHISGLKGNFPWYSMGAMYFLQIIFNFPCYSMGISFFCQFSMLSNCYFAFFLIFC